MCNLYPAFMTHRFTGAAFCVFVFPKCFPVQPRVILSSFSFLVAISNCLPFRSINSTIKFYGAP